MGGESQLPSQAVPQAPNGLSCVNEDFSAADDRNPTPFMFLKRTRERLEIRRGEKTLLLIVGTRVRMSQWSWGRWAMWEREVASVLEQTKKKKDPNSEGHLPQGACRPGQGGWRGSFLLLGRYEVRPPGTMVSGQVCWRREERGVTKSAHGPS